MTAQLSQPELMYEFIQAPDRDARVRHALETLAGDECMCLSQRIVVPSDAIGDDNNIPTPHGL